MALDIRLLKLINTEEILTEVTMDGGNFLKIKNPVRIAIVPSKADPKTPTVGLAPWAEFSDEKEFTLDKDHILLIMKPIQEFINQYNSIFGGIVMPSSKIMMPD
jgi:hypothetical protein